MTVGEAPRPGLRGRTAAWVESAPVQKFVIVVILLNAAILGMETSPGLRAEWGPWLVRLDMAALAVFVAELGIKLWAHGPRFFRSAWNVFDLVVVGIALVPASGPLAVLRALRVLRVLRLASMMPRLRFVVEALLRAIPGIGAIGGLILILFYVAAVIATSLFGSDFPEWFGGLGASFYSLFQIMTLESWSMGIVRPVMEVHPWAWAFFVPFILLATFTMLNLFIAVIVNAMQTLHDRDVGEAAIAAESPVEAVAAAPEAALADLGHDIRELRRELAELRTRLAHPGDGPR
ncbi:ion transporter [Luteimonas sp. RD2P54]|uniref:Ion transporter n=1 Tax=Luteimonas endophytica TaxID=3042023 RepID=A0ABT6J7G7_9GAMM|nr:ion transporter [Luteimonas endophytica]MDH5822118.1 ion transporter [Luteimonas endophytica]